jgi:hypothetical protein
MNVTNSAEYASEILMAQNNAEETTVSRDGGQGAALPGADGFSVRAVLTPFQPSQLSMIGSMTGHIFFAFEMILLLQM